MEQMYEDYLRYLGDLAGLLEKMAGTAKEKAAAARIGDLVQVDACMKQEQAYSMSLRSMDQKREKMHKALGWEGVSLSQTAERFPQELRGRAAKAAELALNRYEGYHSAANAARTVMELALRDIERMFPENQPAPKVDPTEEPPPRMKTDFRA